MVHSIDGVLLFKTSLMLTLFLDSSSLFFFSSSLSVARLGHTEVHKDCPRRPAKGSVLVVIGVVLVVNRPRLWRVVGQRIIAHRVPEQWQIQCQMDIIQRPKLVPPITVPDNLNV